MPGAPLLLGFLLLACDQQDYGLGQPVPSNPPGVETVQVSIDIALQRADGDGAPSRCQVQVAFTPVWSQDPDALGAMDQAAPEGSVILAEPEQPGDCALTLLPDPEEGDSEEPGPAPGDDEDNWQLSGSLAGPPAVFLESETTSLALLPVQTADGGMRYELPDCDGDVFPHGEILDLVVPDYSLADDQALGIEPFTVPAAIAVGADLDLLAPQPDSGDFLPHPVREPLEVAWSFAGPPPQATGQDLVPALKVAVYNQHHERTEGSEWLICAPAEDGGLTLPPELLRHLSVNDSAEGTTWTASVDVHTTTLAPEWTTPWGEPMWVEANLAEGSTIRLHR